MKQDLIDMKSSQNMGVNLKRKVESFLAAIDTKLRGDGSNNTTFNQQYSSGVINNNVGMLQVNKRDNEETSSGSRKKQKSRPSTSTTDESEINDLFNPETQPTNQPLFSNLPTRIQDIEPSDFEVEVKHPYILNQVSISSAFCAYQRDIALLNNSRGLLVESNPHELLAINNILLLKPGQKCQNMPYYTPQLKLQTLETLN